MSNQSPKIGILATGSRKYHGRAGSTCRSLLEAARSGMLNATVAFVASYHECGSIERLSREYGVPFEHIHDPNDPALCSHLNDEYSPNYLVLAGYVKVLRFLNPVSNILNTHPALQSAFDGHYGSAIHAAVASAIQEGNIDQFGFRVHFVGPEVDKGPTIFSYRMCSRRDMTAEDVKRIVSSTEKKAYVEVINAALAHRVGWDGVNNDSLNLPDGWKINLYCQPWA